MMPMMMMMAGLTATATMGKDTAARVLDTVKMGLVQYELSGIRDTLVQEHIYGGIDDLVDDNEAWVEHLQGSMSGGHDTAFDLWDNPYQLRKLSPGKYVVMSFGANGYEDGGCTGETADVIKEWETRIEEWDIEKLREDEELTALPEDDDICVPFTVSKHSQVYQPLSGKRRR